MTGIKGAAVTPFRCADAEQKGLLVTSGYVLPGNLSTKSAPAVTPAPLAAAPAAAPVVAPSVAPAPVAAVPAIAAPPVSAAVPTDGSQEAEVTAAFTRFIAAQNGRDRVAVSQVLLDSKDFVLGQSGGNSVWGYKESLDAFEAAWKGTWILDPQSKELRIASASPGVCMLAYFVDIRDAVSGLARAAGRLILGSWRALSAKAIQIVGEGHRAAIAFADEAERFLLVPQGPKHAVGQHEAVRIRGLGDHTDEGRWHVERTRRPVGAFGNGVVDDQQVGTAGKFLQIAIVAVAVTAEHQRTMIEVNPPGQCRH
jgi:hypothetical protein